MSKKMKKLKPKKDSLLFKLYKAFIKLFKKKVKYYYLGDKFDKSSLILSNHESTKGPLAWEFYCDKKVRFLGNEEMNSGLLRMYKYQTRVYYHEKKHWDLFLARLFCLLATPLTWLFYSGLHLISIRDGAALRRTINAAYISLNDFKENLVIFPEDSTKGYLEELEGFKHGFLLICEYAYKKGLDLDVVVAYYQRKNNLCVVDSPIKYSTLLSKYQTRDKIAEALKDRCNELGKMQFNDKK